MEHNRFRHQALIYNDADEYLAGTVPFLRAGLDAGEALMVAVGPDQTRMLEGELGRDADGVQFLDMRQVGRNPGLIIPLWREFVDAAGGRPVRGIGEPVWAARSEAALEECQRHEGLLNAAFDHGSTWSLLCPYDASTLGGEVLEKVAHSHPVVCRDGVTEESWSFVADADSFAGQLPPPVAPVESLDFGLAGLSEVRRRVSAAAGRMDMDPDCAAGLVIAASELAANSVVHGGGNGTLRLWVEEERLLAEVEDRGRMTEQLVGRVRPDVAQGGGRGLWLANQLCDLVQIRSGERGTTVRLHAMARQVAYAGFANPS